MVIWRARSHDVLHVCVMRSRGQYVSALHAALNAAAVPGCQSFSSDIKNLPLPSVPCTSVYALFRHAVNHELEKGEGFVSKSACPWDRGLPF